MKANSETLPINPEKHVLSFWIQADREFIVPNVEIRERSDDGKTFNRPYSSWRSEFKISAQGNMNDTERDHLYGQSVGASIAGFGSSLEQPTTAFKKAGKYVEKFLVSNPYPKTFGDYVIMLAKAFGFKTIIIENENERTWQDRKYNVHDLVSGGRAIDWMISEKAPHIKRLN